MLFCIAVSECIYNSVRIVLLYRTFVSDISSAFHLYSSFIYLCNMSSALSTEMLMLIRLQNRTSLSVLLDELMLCFLAQFSINSISV